MGGVKDIVERLEAFAARHYYVEGCEIARAAAHEIRLLRVRQWMPIETAPKGVILILNDNGATFGWFDPYAGEWRTGDDFHYRCHPTHWMALPEPPK